jgi:hypothetical protein
MAKAKLPKTQIRNQPTGVRQPKTRLRAQPPTRVIRRTVVVSEKPEGAKWFGVSPWIVIVGVIGVLLLLFLPLFSATKTVQKTETVMVPVQKERQEQVTQDETIKVYQGYLAEKSTQVARTGYTYEYDYYGNLYTVPYTYYETVPGIQIPIDAVAEIVQMQQSAGPNDTWVVTLTANDQTQVVHRDIAKDGVVLTKTGNATVKVTKTVSVPYTEQEPQQVTKNEDIKVRVNLIQLASGNF